MQNFPYRQIENVGVGMPILDIKLDYGSREIVTSALVDSGASLNILPFDIGIELGLVWEQQTYPIQLGGVLQQSKAFAVLLDAHIGNLPTRQLAFAWVNRPSSTIRTLLGQVNFFQEFDVHFYGSKQAFSIELHSSSV